MKNKFLALIAGVAILFTSCADPDLDPLKVADIKKSSLIALRGKAVTNLNNTAFAGAIDSISKSANLTAKNIEFEADFISEDINGLATVEVFANLDGKTGVKVATVQGSAFAVPSGGKYARGKISVPMSAILTAIAKPAASLEVDSYITLTSDITLKDGTKVNASQIVNSSLFETAFFYPAHKVFCLVRP
ncbi:MAG: hypothetical protein U5L45_10800 [Saprospiraceae bacterium]|nr:hypothetical protein [Saprospiraceae bacterium]